MATEAARSSGAADSYIGSLISLTSKFEIRYEGILYKINTEESTIGLKNVRSFGTEGRKKDGPQIPPSDKVYDYILFRGSDIKDLQVKSSPPAQTPPVHSDPAIIQSHYSQPPPPVPTSVPPLESGPAADLVSHTAPGLPANPNLHPSQAAPPASAPPVGSGTAPDLASHAAPSLPRSTYQGGLPLYTSSVNLGSWGASPGMPMPNANGPGVAVPPGYWQGYYVPPSGLAPHIQQFRPQPPGLPMHHPLQQPLHYASMNTGLPTNAPYLSEFSSPLLPPISLASTTGGIYPGSASAPLTSALGPTQASALASETSTAATTNQAPITSPNLGLNNSLMPSSYDAKNTSAPVSDKSQALPRTTFRPQTLSHSLSASVVSAPITRTETLVVPSLATPGQLLQPGPNTLTSSKAEPVENKDVEAMPTISSEQSLLGAGDHQAPILPLPTPYSNKVDGSAAPPMRNSYRGRERGRGSGISRDGTKFTEEFDFSAMNERFNKDEVWGELGKSKGYADEDKDLDKEVDYSKQDNKPVYVKDDFFDTLSCNSLDRGNRNGWTRFSEQMKLDTETFGDFPRHRGNRGGRGPPRGGRGRGSYYGRGYGYVGRGRS